MKQSFMIRRSNRRRYAFLLVFLLLAIFALIYDINTAFTKNDDLMVEGISESLIRFHVIANSDSAEDQALKLKVKDGVVDLMEQILSDSKNIDTSRALIIENMDRIQKLAEDIVLENGFTDSIQIDLKQELFPLKKYGDIVLPPGKYEALVIRIGAAQGKNWWCILFPPLCFVDATHGVVDDESKEGLKKVLTQEEYSQIIMTKDEEVDIKVKSKLAKWLQARDITPKGIRTFGLK